MNPFENFTENECIFCQTQEEWNEITAMNPSNALTNDRFNLCEKTVYYPKLDNQRGRYGDLLLARQYSDDTIHQASEFLKPKTECLFEHLEEIEVSNDNKHWTIRNFIGYSSKGRIAAEDLIYSGFGVYKYARKINHERTDAINKIKETMKKFDIKIEEI